MPVCVSLLRAVNVGGRTIPMGELRALYEELGHHDVVTYLQSGNVISRSTARRAAAVERAVSTAISAAFGMDVPFGTQASHVDLVGITLGARVEHKVGKVARLSHLQPPTTSGCF